MRHHSGTVRRSCCRASCRDLTGFGPRRAVTDSSEALAARGDLRLEYGCNAVAQPEIRRADNAGRGTQITIAPAGALCGDALHKLRLAEHSKLFGSIGAIHRTAFNEHRLTDIVPLRVRHQMLEEITLRRPRRIIPQMMMRIDDRKFRLQWSFLCQRKPILRGLSRSIL